MPEPVHVHLDAVGGVAGDMFVAALLDARPDLKPRVLADLAAVVPAKAGTAALTEGVSGGIAACRFGLVGGHAAEAAGHDGHGTSFAELARRIESASLQPGTAAQALAILSRLGECESRLHRVALQDVHLHELGDWDSLLDVVAAGSIVAALGSCSWSVSDLPRGGGTVRTQHGWLPVPAPATVELLRDFRWRDDGVGGERVTPTGAAILAHLAPAAHPPANGLVLRSIGTGAGTRELPGMPNVLRALVFAVEARPAGAPGHADEVIVIDFDIDDMTGEEIGVAAERLRAADGVLDLSLGSRLGKKNRPLTDFRLLIRPQALAAVSTLCFDETSTLGLRWRREQRLCLPRSGEEVDVEGTTLRRKRGARPGGQASLKVESDDLARFEGLIRRRSVRARGEQGSEEP
ncbi:MAG TPA: LarC family nickel insertion protein [Quisquiliibacterium sp.]|nr:LarC family nickel insertion protein [Quisquiliibacterium sp.]